MILMSIFALTKRLIVSPFSETLVRATALSRENDNEDEDDPLTEEIDDYNGYKMENDFNAHFVKRKTRLGDLTLSPINTSLRIDTSLNDSRQEMLFLTQNGGLCLTCVCGRFLSPRTLKKIVRLFLMIGFVLTVAVVASILGWLLASHTQIVCPSTEQFQGFVNGDRTTQFSDLSTLWSLNQEKYFNAENRTFENKYHSRELEENFSRNVFNTPGHLHIIQAFDDCEGAILNTVMNQELKGVVFNLESHQSIRSSIAHTILPYRDVVPINSLALKEDYFLSQDESKLGAIFNEMLHQTLVLTEYLSNDGFGVLLDAFQNVLKEYHLQHPDLGSRLHIIIQKPETLTVYSSEDDRTASHQFIQMISTLIDHCEVTVIVLPRNRSFLHWLKSNYNHLYKDIHTWYLGASYNSALKWLKSEYGSVLSKSQTHTLLSTIGTSIHTLWRTLQEYISGKQFTDIINYYKEEALLDFEEKLRNQKQPGLLFNLFKTFDESSSSCPEIDRITASKMYRAQFLDALEHDGVVYLQSGTSLYGSCHGNAWKPVHRYMTGYREFISRNMTVLAVKVHKDEHVYHIKIDDLSVASILSKLQDYSVDTSDFWYFAVNGSRWQHGQIHARNGHVLQFLTTQSELFFTSLDSSTVGWINWLVSLLG